MLEKIDSAILAVCAKFSHRLQRMTGLTNYFVAKIGVACSAFNIIVATMNHFYQLLSYTTSAAILWIFGIVLCTLVRDSFNCSKAEEQLWSGRNAKPARLLQYISRGKFWRLLWISLFILDVDRLWHTLPRARYWLPEIVAQTFFSLGFALFYYFIAVDPLPPGKSKVREWLENFGLFQKPVPVPTEN